MKRPPLIHDMGTIKSKISLLEVLGDIQVCRNRAHVGLKRDRFFMVYTLDRNRTYVTLASDNFTLFSILFQHPTLMLDRNDVDVIVVPSHAEQKHPRSSLRFSAMRNHHRRQDVQNIRQHQCLRPKDARKDAHRLHTGCGRGTFQFTCRTRCQLLRRKAVQ